MRKLPGTTAAKAEKSAMERVATLLREELFDRSADELTMDVDHGRKLLTVLARVRGSADAWVYTLDLEAPGAEWRACWLPARRLA